MHDHDIEPDAAAPGSGRPHDEHAVPSGQEIGRGVEAGRPDALGPGGLLHLQQAAGNAGVASLVAQRRASPEADADDHDRDRSPVHDVVRSPGTPLDPHTRADMEAAVGHDFGDVQVHTDATAAASARSVQAHAYTVGNHVVFGEGRYRPETPEGRHTLAHELTHVVQQRQGPVDGTAADGGIKVSHPSDRFEQEAESVARRVTDSATAAAPAEPAGAGPAPASADVQRQEASAERVVQRQAEGDEQEDEEAPPPEAEAAAAGPETADATGETEAPAETAAEAPTEAAAEAPADQAAGPEPAGEGPTDAMPAEGPAPEGPDEAVEDDEDASVTEG